MCLLHFLIFASDPPNRVVRNWRRMNVIVMCDDQKERRVLQPPNLVDMKSVEVMRATGVGGKGLPLVVNLHEGVGGDSEPVVA
jgi:hypothetical protein